MAGCSSYKVTCPVAGTDCEEYEDSSNHQKTGTAWMRKQRDKADWQAHIDKAAELTALQRAGQTADPQLRTLLALVFKHMVKFATTSDPLQSTKFSVDSFPYPAALGEWLSAKKCQGVKGNSIGRQRGIVGILVTCSRGPEVVDFVRKLCFLYAIICQEAAGLPAKAYTRPGSLCRLLCKPRNKSCRDAVLEAGQANARKDPA
eukprot:1156039-Pelagomonas_calceolata.AAC.3